MVYTSIIYYIHIKLIDIQSIWYIIYIGSSWGAYKIIDKLFMGAPGLNDISDAGNAN